MSNQDESSRKSNSDTGPSQTSGNREESAAGADNDEFGKQSPARSGTTPLGEPGSVNEKPAPGGVEGTGGNS